MNQLRLRIELNKGGLGISLDKLANITEETAKFLKMLVRDVDRDILGSWIARDFANNSVDFTAELIGQVSPEQVQACKHAMVKTMSSSYDEGDLESVIAENVISRATLLQYTKIATPIDPDEVVHFGLLNGHKDSEPVERFILSKERALDIQQRLALSNQIEYDGSIQGVIHALFKEVEKPHCRVRELYSDELITCYFNRSLYDDIVHALHKKDTVVHIAGVVTASRTERKPLYMTIKKIQNAEEYLEGDLEKFFGCAPHATGDMTTDEFIDEIRGEDEFA
jgi:hypothetical protein